MTRQRALRLAREWAQGHKCTLRDGEAAEYHSMFAAMLEESMPNESLPVLVNDEQGREYIDYICPRCKGIISQRRRGQRMETVYQCKYHDNCGQRVDWTNPQPDRHPPEGEEDT